MQQQDQYRRYSNNSRDSGYQSDRDCRTYNQKTPTIESVDQVLSLKHILDEEQLANLKLVWPDQVAVSEEISGVADYKKYASFHRQKAAIKYFLDNSHRSWLSNLYETDPTLYSNSSAVQSRRADFLQALNADRMDDFAALELEDGSDLASTDANASSNLRTMSSSISLTSRLAPIASLFYETNSHFRNPIVFALGNISMDVSHKQLSDFVLRVLSAASGKSLDECISLCRIEQGLPAAEKDGHRLAWIHIAIDALQTNDAVDRESFSRKMLSLFDEMFIEGQQRIYASPHKPTMVSIRVLSPNELCSDSSVDFQAAKDAIMLLDGEDQCQELLKYFESKAEKHCLDVAICYLRFVHCICFYSAAVGGGPCDLVQQTGSIAVVRPMAATASDVSGDHIPERLRRFKNLVSRLTSRWSVEDLCEVSESGISIKISSEETILRRWIEAVDQGRFRCKSCQKLFKGPEFVVKHLRLKHEDLSSQAVRESQLLVQFLAHPPLTAILSLAESNLASRSHRQSNDRNSSSRSSSHRHRSRSPARRSDHHHHQRSHHRPSHAAAMPPPDNVQHDPRSMRQYVDWDAPATGDVVINYDD